MSVPTVSLQMAVTLMSTPRSLRAFSRSSTLSFPTHPVAENPFVQITSVERLIAVCSEGNEKVKPRGRLPSGFASLSHHAPLLHSYASSNVSNAFLCRCCRQTKEASSDPKAHLAIPDPSDPARMQRCCACALRIYYRFAPVLPYCTDVFWG